MISEHIRFTNQEGIELAARLDLPPGRPRATALFAHCFTCSKDLISVRTIAETLTASGIAVLRFDFTGLGQSGGEFSKSNFATHIDDLKAAATYLTSRNLPPALLIGHSLGGAAVLCVANDIPSVGAVVTIGAPSDTIHVADKFSAQIDEIKTSGSADVVLAGRTFSIEEHFLEALDSDSVTAAAKRLRPALLIMHSPVDDEVSIDHASRLFLAAKHPKSFISLDTADHLLTRSADAEYVAKAISGWADRYLPAAHTPAVTGHGVDVTVTETGSGQYQNGIWTGRHHLLADEPKDLQGTDSGPTPYEFLAAALGACTSITLRMYANRKSLSVDRISCRVTHEKRQRPDDADEGFRPDLFTRYISLTGALTNDQRIRLIEIANRCPVHRTLETGAHIETKEDRS